MTKRSVKYREEIINLIAQGHNDLQISRITKHSRKLIRQVRAQIKDGNLSFFTDKKIGRPTKKTDKLIQSVREMTEADRRMSSKQIAEVISSDSSTTVSPELIRQIRCENGYSYLPPKTTFILTKNQAANRLDFANFHITNQTDWSNVLFTDESYIYLDNDHRWLWRKRGENDDEVYHKTLKFTPKILIFAGISRQFKTDVIILDKSVDSISYIDDCIDGSGLIPSMNEIYGIRKWKLMQDGATAHTSKLTMDYLNSYVDVLESWPSGSPDLNPIENLWAIIKKRIEDKKPGNLKELRKWIIETWNSIDQQTINNLIDSMDNRLNEVVKANGWRTRY